MALPAILGCVTNISFSEVLSERVAYFQFVYSSIINRALILNVAVANRQVRQTPYRREKWHVKKPIGSKAKSSPSKIYITNVYAGKIIA